MGCISAQAAYGNRAGEPTHRYTAVQVEFVISLGTDYAQTHVRRSHSLQMRFLRQYIDTYEGEGWRKGNVVKAKPEAGEQLQHTNASFLLYATSRHSGSPRIARNSSMQNLFRTSGSCWRASDAFACSSTRSVRAHYSRCER